VHINPARINPAHANQRTSTRAYQYDAAAPASVDLLTLSGQPAFLAGFLLRRNLVRKAG